MLSHCIVILDRQRQAKWLLSNHLEKNKVCICSRAKVSCSLLKPAARIESSTMSLVDACVQLNCPKSSARAAKFSAWRKMATLNVTRSRYMLEMRSNAVASATL